MSSLREVETVLILFAVQANKPGSPPLRKQLSAAAHDINLRAMYTMRLAFGVPVGYSDHTEGDEVPLAAVSLGASVLEKHFTLDRSLPGLTIRPQLNQKD